MSLTIKLLELFRLFWGTDFISTSISSTERIFLITLNTIINMGILACGLTGFFHLFNSSLPVAIHNFVVMLLLTLPKILLWRQKYELALYSFIIQTDFILYFYAVALGRSAGLQNIIMIPTIIPLIFRIDKKMLFASSMSLILYVYIYLSNFYNPFKIDVARTEWNEFHSNIFCVICVLVVIWIFQKSHQLTIKTLDEERILTFDSSRIASLHDLSGAIAHEISNPLMIITGKSAKIQKLLEHTANQNSEQIKKEIESLQSAAVRIDSIVKTMKNLLDADEQTASAQINLPQLVEQTIGIAKIIDNRCKINFLNEVGEVYVAANSAHLSQAILNLISNSVQAIKQDSNPWIAVKLYYSEDRKLVLVRITDSGLGIPPKIVSKMMEPFYTTKGQHRNSSSGLGLPTSKRIIEKLNGTLDYDSKYSNTSFIIQLPIQKSAA